MDVRKSCNPADYPEFGDLPESVVEEKVKKIIGWIWKKEPPDDIICENSVLIKIIDMVERRRVYFHIYHGIDMSEWNEISLYCFWIIKLQPFHRAIPKAKNIPHTASNKVNANIVYRLLKNAIPMMIENMSQEDKGKIKTNYRKNTIHALRHRDISKESFMIIMESLLKVSLEEHPARR